MSLFRSTLFKLHLSITPCTAPVGSEAVGPGLCVRWSAVAHRGCRRTNGGGPQRGYRLAGPPAEEEIQQAVHYTHVTSNCTLYNKPYTIENFNNLKIYLTYIKGIKLDKI